MSMRSPETKVDILSACCCCLLIERRGVGAPTIISNNKQTLKSLCFWNQCRLHNHI